MPEASFLFSQYGHVVDLLPEMVLILDDENRVLDANKIAVDELGVIVRPSHPKYVFDIIPEDERTVFRNLFPFTDQLKFETKFRRRDRSVIDVRGMVRILHSGQTKYWVLVMRDVTKEKRKELDLLRFSNVIHNTINPIQISDANGTMVYVNPAFEKVTGYSNTELIGKNPNILNSRKHSKEFWSGVWKHIISGKVWIGRIENRRKDGSPFFTELVISPIVDSHGKIAGYLGAHRDITEQIILEQQLVRSQRMEVSALEQYAERKTRRMRRDVHGLRPDRQGSRRARARHHDLDGARGVRDREAPLRPRGLPRPRRLCEEHDHRRGADGRRDPGGGRRRRPDAADARAHSAGAPGRRSGIVVFFNKVDMVDDPELPRARGARGSRASLEV